MLVEHALVVASVAILITIVIVVASLITMLVQSFASLLVTSRRLPEEAYFSTLLNKFPRK